MVSCTLRFKIESHQLLPFARSNSLELIGRGEAWPVLKLRQPDSNTQTGVGNVSAATWQQSYLCIGGRTQCSDCNAGTAILSVKNLALVLELEVCWAALRVVR